MRIAIVRQRPSIGDCLLLGPLIREVKRKHPESTLTVITDPDYLGGALVTAFEGIPGIDRIEQIPAAVWTDAENKAIDPILRMASDELPMTLRRATKVLNCNSAFIKFEREHAGAVPYGIAEFWLRHHGYWYPGANLSPVYNVKSKIEADVDAWLAENAGKRIPVGVVLRAGDPVRDWNHDNLAVAVVEWLYTRGYCPITIDPFQKAASTYAVACIGRRIDFVAGLLSRCKAVITPDTGLLHLAEAVGTPTVALWGIMPPELRVDRYNTTLVPRSSLGFCTGPELSGCKCHGRAQQWSCLRRLRINHITRGMETAGL